MNNDSISYEQILVEVEDVLRTAPDKATFRHETNENYQWLGRAAAVIEVWNPNKLVQLRTIMGLYQSPMGAPSIQGFREIMVLLHQARSDLRMRTTGPTNVAIGQGQVFEYFDEIRKNIELATQEVFFIDPYLDADFVSRYLPLIKTGVNVKLLTARNKLTTLLPAIDLFMQQHGHAIGVRSTTGLHDRFLFIDKGSCYLSGASFKDGAKNAGTIITQITDGFTSMWNTYDKLWSAANIER
ncbi:MAG TPA: hypothetical protein VFT64_01235 [Rickettsiales bacterium]|nr:hypothetical protein [Rickettsiales bacterium]